MRYLFFLLSFLYSFIFYVFYTFSLKKDIFFNDLNNNLNIINLSLKDSIIFSNSDTFVIQSIFGNLLYEIIIFFFISIFLFFYFSSDKENISNPKENNNLILKIFTFGNIIIFLKKFSYYIGFILFYLSLYLISLSFEFINFSFFILFVNILIFLFYFISKFSLISRNFLKINSIIFSFFYLVNYFFILINDQNYFNLIDFINSFLILLIFPVLLYYDRILSKKENFDNSLLINFSLYIFGVFLFYFYYYIFHQNILFWITIISTIFGIIWFEYLPKINLLKKDKIILRYIGIIFTYVGVVFGLIHQFFDYSIVIFLILLLQVFYNLFIHKKYINYISLFLGIFIFIYIIFYNIIYFNLIDYKSVNFLFLTFGLSFFTIILTYFIKLKIVLDYYIIHIFSHIINVVGIILFFIFNNFEILYIGILLLLESIYFFLSYYKLNPNKN